MTDYPFGTGLQIRLVLWLGGNAREAKILGEFRDSARFVLLQVFNNGLHEGIVGAEKFLVTVGYRELP